MKKKAGSPDSPWYSALLWLFRTVTFFKKFRVETRRQGLSEIEGPICVVANHASRYDMYYLAELLRPRRAVIVANRLLWRNPLIRFAADRIGAIPKKMFYPDLETIRRLFEAVRRGHSVMLFPEGRLSLDGTNHPLIAGTGALIKKLRLPLIAARIEGAYLTNAKWRKKDVRGTVRISVTGSLTKEALALRSGAEIERWIGEKIRFNDFDFAKREGLCYRGKKLAEGLEKILPRCPRCGTEYGLETKGNTLFCPHCGAEYRLTGSYGFAENQEGLRDVHECYARILEMERARIGEDFCLESRVQVTRLGLKSKKEDQNGAGICRLTKESFSFDGTCGAPFSFSVSPKSLTALPFTVGSGFECYYENRPYRFRPENPKECVRWAMLMDLLIS